MNLHATLHVIEVPPCLRRPKQMHPNIRRMLHAALHLLGHVDHTHVGQTSRRMVVSHVWPHEQPPNARCDRELTVYAVPARCWQSRKGRLSTSAFWQVG